MAPEYQFSAKISGLQGPLHRFWEKLTKLLFMLYVCPVKQWGHESLSSVSKGSSFPRCDAVLLGV
jgi:hypothetical protein